MWSWGIEWEAWFVCGTMILGYINRTANKNGTARIMGGKELRNWIKNNFKANDTMKVDIISPIEIRLY